MDELTIARIAKIEQLVEDMYDRLFGTSASNGELDKLAVIQRLQDSQIRDLEKDRSRMHGAMGVLGFLITVIGGSLLSRLF